MVNVDQWTNELHFVWNTKLWILHPGNRWQCHQRNAGQQGRWSSHKAGFTWWTQARKNQIERTFWAHQICEWGCHWKWPPNFQSEHLMHNDDNTQAHFPSSPVIQDWLWKSLSDDGSGHVATCPFLHQPPDCQPQITCQLQWQWFPLIPTMILPHHQKLVRDDHFVMSKVVLHKENFWQALLDVKDDWAETFLALPKGLKLACLLLLQCHKWPSVVGVDFRWCSDEPSTANCYYSIAILVLWLNDQHLKEWWWDKRCLIQCCHNDLTPGHQNSGNDTRSQPVQRPTPTRKIS